jgi:hypothetical protein
MSFSHLKEMLKDRRLLLRHGRTVVEQMSAFHPLQTFSGHSAFHSKRTFAQFKADVRHNSRFAAPHD